MKLTVKNEKKILQCITDATSLQEALQKVYTNGASCKLTANEETLFGTVLCYFKNKPNCTIWETHKKDKVRSVSATRCCEISDLLIVTFSPSRMEIKINFLQAKKAAFDNKSLGLVNSGGKSFLKFHIDGTQYRLLKDLPQIDPLHTIFPGNILADACTDSITSYGVFYQDGGTVEMGYEITQLLQPNDPSTVIEGAKNKTCSFGTTLDTYGVNHRGGCHYIRGRRLCMLRCFWHPDLHSTLSANTFETALLDFRVGSPLCGWSKIDFVHSIEYNLPLDNQVADDFRTFVNKSIRRWYREANEYEYWEEWRPAHVSDNDTPRDSMLEYDMYVPRYIMLLNIDRIREEKRIRD